MCLQREAGGGGGYSVGIPWMANTQCQTAQHTHIHTHQNSIPFYKWQVLCPHLLYGCQVISQTLLYLKCVSGQGSLYVRIYIYILLCALDSDFIFVLARRWAVLTPAAPKISLDMFCCSTHEHVRKHDRNQYSDLCCSQLHACVGSCVYASFSI